MSNSEDSEEDYKIRRDVALDIHILNFDDKKIRRY